MRVNFLQDWDAEIGDLGVELEFSNINREGYKFREAVAHRLMGYKIVHDASPENYAYKLGGLKIEGKCEKDKKIITSLAGNYQTLGGEITSPIIKGTDWEDDIYKLIDILVSFGESNDTLKDSLHVHVNLGNSVPLSILTRLLKIVSSYEAILYRLGGLGRVNRGEHNQYTYQRPYLGNGFPVYAMGASYYPICNYNDLLNANNKQDFFLKLGDTIYQIQGEKRYVTQRYMGVNFYTVPCYGSIEFRHANKSLIPEYNIAWIKLCKAVVRKAFYLPEDKTEEKLRPLYENKEIDNKDFMEVLESLELDAQTKLVLLQIWKETPTPKFDNIHRLSHLKTPTFYSRGSNYIPDALDDNVDVKPAIYEDIHNIKAPNYPKTRSLIQLLFPNRKIMEEIEIPRRIPDNKFNFVADFPEENNDLEEALVGRNIYFRANTFQNRYTLQGNSLNLGRLEPGTDYEIKYSDILFASLYAYHDESVSVTVTFIDEDGVDWEYHMLLQKNQLRRWDNYPMKDLLDDMWNNPADYFDFNN